MTSSHATTPAPAPPRARISDVLAREARTHLGFAGVLLGVGLGVPLLAAGVGLMFPSVAEMVSLDTSAVVALEHVAELQWLLCPVLLLVAGASFAARVLLVPGRAVGRVTHDVLRRPSTVVGLALAVANFAALWLFTDAVEEVWVFPVLVFSTCQITGVLLERLRHPENLPW